MASPAYKPFLDTFGTIMSGSPQLSHVDLQPSASEAAKAISAPVTEVATFYFDGEPNADWLDNAAKAREWLVKEAGESLGAAFGITHEVVEYKGVKGKAAVLVAGWSSKEAHVEFRGMETFRENIPLLRGDSKAIEMHHVVLMHAVR